MDAFGIAQLMANQDPARPLKLRYGTVASIESENMLHALPDGAVDAVPAVRCCDPIAGSRVVLLVKGTEWLTVATVGGDRETDERLNALEAWKKDTTVTDLSITTFTSGWTTYGSDGVHVRKFGKHVDLSGTLKNTAAWNTANGGVSVFNIPVQLAPPRPCRELCQGSGSNKYLCAANSNGSVVFERYGTTTWASAAAGSWFPFSLSWIID